MKAFTRLKAQDTLKTLEPDTEWHIINIEWAISGELNANCMGIIPAKNEKWWPRSDAAAERHLGGNSSHTSGDRSPQLQIPNTKYQFQLSSMP